MSFSTEELKIDEVIVYKEEFGRYFSFLEKYKSILGGMVELRGLE